MTQTILANAMLILPDRVLRGQIRLAEGRIAEIAEGGAVPPSAVDCAGDLVLPGLVELHTDNLERHLQPRPKVEWPHQAAIVAHDAELASTGITTVFDALRVGSVFTSSNVGYGEYARALATEILQLRAQGALRISHFLHLRAEICSETLVEEMAKFGPEDRVGIVSLMDHTPGQRQFRDIGKLRDYVIGKRGLSDAEFDAHVESQQALRDRLGALHEATAVAEARRYGAVLASHDDTTAGQVAVSASHGARLAEFPTTEEAARACRDRGIAVMMGAPNLIRGGSHSGNVAAHVLAEAGLLDILSSDYVPSSLLTAALMLGDLWNDMPRGVATVTSAPAAAAGLADRGALRPGARADVIRVARLGNA
ncbi:alpha-D-ribose 1-methylphosphonate 5-triphosphate diphosphatase, partial [Paracoccus binzhouensis]|uniref:alpha-D-ribose 1-methylphosphonate 5-triphosphate diphosphatase n=1 Tax=Paracoccus binzhouensis TaxID=2796149 RepID=UPI0018EF2947